LSEAQAREAKTAADAATEAVDSLKAEFTAEARKRDNGFNALRVERDRALLVLRAIASTAFVAVGIASLVVMNWIPWQWLAEHPSRLGVNGCLGLAVCGGGWAIFDHRRRKLAIGSIVLGAVLVLLQIIGR
jgi:hypothetical protein